MSVSVVRRTDPEAVGAILASLPEWFGIPEANASYVADAGRLPSYLAVDADDPDDVVGVALLAEHFPGSRELHLLAVRRDRHREGIGRALVGAVASDLREAGVRLLEVHTVGPSHESAGYAATRAFYLAQDFVALTELQRIDWDGPTLILVRPL
ncbi:GNAT family N-acetyltransferase [Nocardioides cynanchi]|uniref:GNAT family N-acetyltransferase n=1 Tax=Nocardioides cynanchi TaxID=2558918 RepID=UPI001244496C|nr:GNAT family N-acetyltransferase [Nocardioides cynanchi]